MTKSEEKMLFDNHFLIQALFVDYCNFRAKATKQTYDEVEKTIRKLAKHFKNVYEAQNN